MSHTTTGQVLGASTTVGGVAILPLTGGSTYMLILPFMAIVCGSIILVTLTLIRLKERQENSQ